MGRKGEIYVKTKYGLNHLNCLYVLALSVSIIKRGLGSFSIHVGELLFIAYIVTSKLERISVGKKVSSKDWSIQG